MNLNFKIDKYYLLTHALGQFDEPFSEWNKIKEDLWKNHPLAYYLLVYRTEAIFIKGNLKKANLEAENFIKKTLKTKEFKRLLSETEKYLKFVKKQWAKNKKDAFKILEELSGLKIPLDKETDIYLTHPKLRNGVNFSQFNAIGWGHSEDWPNYTTVYLCHEIMHLLTSNKLKNQELMHALIELMTDNELRIRLNKKGVYYKEDGLDIGHPNLRNLEKKIYPYWLKYIKDRNKRDIFDLEKQLLELIT